jgi:hypothetical protein
MRFRSTKVRRNVMPFLIPVVEAVAVGAAAAAGGAAVAALTTPHPNPQSFLMNPGDIRDGGGGEHPYI